MAKLIKSNGEVSEVCPKNGTDFQLDELQGFVGGLIEIVYPMTGAPKGTILVVNEEGKLINLPVNGVASAMMGFTDAIVGDVLLCESSQVR